MQLTDIENLADEFLKIDKERDEEAYSFKRVSNDELHNYEECVFDFRIKQERFKSSHATLVVIDKELQCIAGNMSVFLIKKNQFRDLHFWKREIREGKSTFKMITLNEFPDIERVNQVFMHGYIQSPSFTQKKKKAHSYAWAVYRYVRFVICIAELCREIRIPMLLETMGKLDVRNKIARPELDETILTLEERVCIGMTRPASLVTEKMARFLNMRELNNVFNERTFGKVFFSLLA